MIYFLTASGSIAHCVPESVYQGAAEGNKLFLVSPHAASAEVSAAFRLPDGSVTPRYRLEYAGGLNGYSAETGQPVCGWSLSLPVSVTAQYGTVRVQFYFLSAGQGQEASASAQFVVERGVPSQLPSVPEADAYEDIVSALTALRADVVNGYYPARAAVAWSDGHVYGANELVYYSEAGSFGALIRSKASNNVQPPFTDGALNAQYWETAVNFDTIAEDFFADVQAECSAAEAAQAAAETAEENAKASETAAQGYADAASGSAGEAAASAGQAANSATAAGQSAGAAASSASQASQNASAAAVSAGDAADSALAAQGYMEQAKEYAQKEYKICDRFADLPEPGDSACIYLVPSSSATGDDSYAEYLWISEDGKYEFIGSVNDIDLSNYAQINGAYPSMTVGNATKAVQDGDGNNIAANYAKQSGSYSDLAAGSAERLQSQVNVTGVGNNGWYKLGSVTVAQLKTIQNVNASYSLILLVNGNNPSGVNANASATGAVEIDAAVSSSGVMLDTSGYSAIKVLFGDLEANNFAWLLNDAKDTLTVYFNATRNNVGLRQTFTVMNEAYGARDGRAFEFGWEYYGASAPANAVYAENRNIAGAAETLSRSIYINAQANGGWHKFAEFVPPANQGGNAITSAILLCNGINASGSELSGLIEIDALYTLNTNEYTLQEIKILSGNLPAQKICGVQESDKISFYVNLVTYRSYQFTVLSECSQMGGTLADTSGKSDYIQLQTNYYGASAPSGAVYAVNRNNADSIVATHLTDENLNDLVGENSFGKSYYASGNNTVTNKPSGVNSFGLYVIRGGDGLTTQILIGSNGSAGSGILPTSYQRYFNGTAFSEWEEIVTSNGNYQNMTVGNATKDGDGNDIAATYATKSDLNAGLQKLYPVGSIYLSAVATNPATLFGFGTWQAWGTGRVPVGVDASQTEFDTAEKTGGEKEHSLTTDEMPAHTHILRYARTSNDSEIEFPWLNSDAVSYDAAAPAQDGEGDLFGSLTNVNAGGSQPHNNLQPYIACYMWKRTA